MTPIRSTAAVGLPPAASCAAVNMTTMPSATTDTHRFPAGSNATTFGPGIDEPNDGLSMVMSGILSPSEANAAAGYRASGGSALVPPSTHMFPSRSNVNPSEPPVLAATAAADVCVIATAAGVNPNIDASPGPLLMPTHSLPLVGTGAYVTVTTVVSPARTHAFGRSTVPSSTRLVIPDCASLIRSAVIRCVPALAVTEPLVVVMPWTPSTLTTPVARPAITIISVPSPSPATQGSAPPPQPASHAAISAGSAVSAAPAPAARAMRPDP